jgi:hypothetical protein
MGRLDQLNAVPAKSIDNPLRAVSVGIGTVELVALEDRGELGDNSLSVGGLNLASAS